MVLGMSLSAFTTLHVAISLVAIAAGFLVVAGMFASKKMPAMTAVFLVMTLLTDLTGFLFPFEKLLPSHITGIVSLAVLMPTVLGRYLLRLAGKGRRLYGAGAVLSLYLNVFVLVVQAFLKVPALHDLAPKGSEPPFAIAQLPSGLTVCGE